MSIKVRVSFCSPSIHKGSRMRVSWKLDSGKDGVRFVPFNYGADDVYESAIMETFGNVTIKDVTDYYGVDTPRFFEVSAGV